MATSNRQAGSWLGKIDKKALKAAFLSNYSWFNVSKFLHIKQKKACLDFECSGLGLKVNNQKSLDLRVSAASMPMNNVPSDSK